MMKVLGRRWSVQEEAAQKRVQSLGFWDTGLSA